ncbi:Pentachlorophenol 4-monooxygenase [Streptomyces sp. YIM 130001]|uniref:FAD-dependent monooxygenase n=1 Tax=Streptomyces sp. YIM 130001 TaxID=2259644 RepID=UPI000E647A06|nr:FAD-dependent monooxygenase [Streptomyces sp. YIM 130001]RII06897.1 Pentachlorophenol 4-monooxygenase [Streptomyces sp. YIM 130001]
MQSSSHNEVVIAGGGPVGMLIAAELALYGVRARVLETETETSNRPKAGTLHARTVQSLARRGYLDDLTGRSRKYGLTAQPFHFAGLSGLTITVPEMEPPPILKIPQSSLERFFEERARDLGCEVLRGHRVVEARQESDRVEMVVEGPHGRRSQSADYLVGADGARSTVREQFGFPSEVVPASASAMMGLVRLADPSSLPRGWHSNSRGWTVVTDNPEGQSLIRVLDLARPYPERNVPVTPEEFRAEVSRVIGHDVPMEDARFLTRFSDFTRLAQRFRQGRVFLAGDAAHVHFPVGGQGLSTGMLDGFNLAWKLAHVVRGSSGVRLLDTYDEERQHAAQRVVANTRAQLTLMRMVGARDPLHSLFDEMLGHGQADRYLGNLVSAQETAYAPITEHPSPIEGLFLQNLPLDAGGGPSDLIGLMREGRPLLISGHGSTRYADEARPWRNVVRSVEVKNSSGLPCEALLVRPDGYIGWAADGGDLKAALRAWFGAAG